MGIMLRENDYEGSLKLWYRDEQRCMDQQGVCLLAMQ
jgi:hypothetical protein